MGTMIETCNSVTFSTHMQQRNLGATLVRYVSPNFLCGADGGAGDAEALAVAQQQMDRMLVKAEGQPGEGLLLGQHPAEASQQPPLPEAAGDQGGSKLAEPQRPPSSGKAQQQSYVVLSAILSAFVGC